MTNETLQRLKSKRCQSCEGGVPAIAGEEAKRLLKALPGWELTDDGKRIRRSWRAKDFAAGIDFFQRVAQLAEDEGHHPDLHLTEYRQLSLELWTHAIGGLSENDFIMAAKIDDLPIALKGG